MAEGDQRTDFESRLLRDTKRLGGTLAANRVLVFNRCSVTRNALKSTRFLQSYVLIADSPITTLRLNYNELGDGFIDDFATIVELLPTEADPVALRRLELTNSSLTLGRPSFAAILLSSALCLTHLDLSSNAVGDISIFTSGIAACRELVTLSLKHCGLLPGHIVRLVAALDIAESDTLEELHLDYNNVGDGGGVALSDALRSGPSLCVLSLQQAGILERGGLALAEGWRFAPNLARIRLTGNALGDRSVQALLNTVACSQQKNLELEDEMGEVMSDEMYARHTAVCGLTAEARLFLELCTDAWRNLTSSEDTAPSFWTKFGFDRMAINALSASLAQIEPEELHVILTAFSGDVLDAVLRSGADGLVPDQVLLELGSRARCAVAERMFVQDFSRPATLRCLCRRGVRIAFGPNVLGALLREDSNLPTNVRIFLFYGQHINVA